MGVVVAGQFSEPTRADQWTSGSIQLVGQPMVTCRVLVKVHMWFKCVESNFDYANDQPRLDRDTPFTAPSVPAQGSAKSRLDGEENHYEQFGLASREQRWGIEGASFGSSIGQFALANVSRWIETCPPPQSPAWRPQGPTKF